MMVDSSRGISSDIGKRDESRGRGREIAEY